MLHNNNPPDTPATNDHNGEGPRCRAAAAAATLSFATRMGPP